MSTMTKTHNRKLGLLGAAMTTTRLPRYTIEIGLPTNRLFQARIEMNSHQPCWIMAQVDIACVRLLLETTVELDLLSGTSLREYLKVLQ